MTIRLEDLPLKEWQKRELTEAMQNIANLIVYAYDAGYANGFEAGVDEGEDDEGD